MLKAGGKVIGIDLTPEMLERAKANLRMTSRKNVSLQEASAEDLPFQGMSFDTVISYLVFNLIPDKVRALKEIFRVVVFQRQVPCLARRHSTSSSNRARFTISILCPSKRTSPSFSSSLAVR